jgi:hypothetical protein
MAEITKLQAVVGDDKATDKQLKEKIAAVRAAKEKARRELAQAQKDAEQVLTADQIATLIGIGILD